MGSIGTDGRFAVFGSRLTGARAQASLMFGSKRYANLTLREAIAQYAPPKENNTAAYVAAVAAAAGVSPDTKLKDIPAEKRAAVIAGMQAVEGNTGAQAYDEQGNLTDTLDTTSPRTPNTAPTPYGPDSQLADTTPGAPIGHVERAPLGPATPSFGALSPSPTFDAMSAPSGMGALAPTSFSGLATPRGIGMPAAPNFSTGVPAGNSATVTTGVSADAMRAAQATQAVAKAAQAQAAPTAPATSFTSQDEKTNTGNIANAPNPGNFVSQDERASLAERLGLDPSTGVVTPSLDPTAVAPSVASVAPAATVAAPTISVPATVAPAPKVAVSAMSRPALAAPSQPSLSPSDVYGGAIGTAQTSTPGTTVSRATSYGPTYTTNKFGAVTATAPDGTQMAALGGVPTAQPSNIAGPLGQQPDQTQTPGLGGLFGAKAKSATGTLAGAALGAYALGPVGGLLGGLIGKNLAQGKAPLSGLLGNGNSLANTHVVDTFQGPMRAANAVGGLGFPGRPSGPAPGGVAAGMRGLSPGAADAIDHGVGGLY
ncbi:hypothetical protein EN780_03040 [Mesorhizobium sp. M4B.F.Ca.ET.089.01.1.1]|uniref:hypothetical protein n=1 Tax=Mesorhizobium sp. M4B.F.Ca.ET.089.01.1.1 TaxID=2496662 RepID=UPI000FE3D001|nr:hypothetical protein [Mesorhizobium sp. M4B.F.Ca.ET.089.01.1.1]RWX70512.1 hypothetical protein EN780_03040 [Mesorhizobium sp. M4B.F.Ca.ET.089.01.1.1]